MIIKRGSYSQSNVLRKVKSNCQNGVSLKAVSIADEDIKRQEDRVALARKKLQDALRGMPT